MKVVLTAQARHDLLEIADYIAKDNPTRALSFVRELREAALQRGQLHALYPVIQRYEGQRLRRRIQGNYLIFFRIDLREVVIVRVLHGAMDLETLLP